MLSTRFYALFTLCLTSLVSSTAAALGPSVLFPSRHAHYSHKPLRPSIHEIIQSRQAVAPPPLYFTTTRKEERLQSSLKRLRKFGWEVESVRDEMGRLESRLGKLHKRDDVNQRETGQEIHDLLYSLLHSFHTSESTTTTRDLNANFAIKPNRAIASASPIPVPSGRAKRSLVQPQTILTTADVERTLTRTLTSLSSTLTLATSSLSSISSTSQQAAIEALIEDLRWEMQTLLADTQQDVPELFTDTFQSLISSSQASLADSTVQYTSSP